MHRSLLRASRLSNASISRLIWRATPSLASRWSPVNSTLHVAEPRSSPLRSPSHRRSYTTEHSTVTLGSQPIVGECPGCGAPFQEQDPSKPGFLAEPKAEVVKKKKQSNKSMSDEEFFSTMLKLDPEIRAMLGDDPDADGVPVETKSQLEENEQVKEPRICHRCYTLRHHHQMTTETSPAFLRKTLQYGSLNFLTTKRNPLLIALFDIADMPSSLGPLPNLLRQNPTARVFLVANKVDMLPARARRHEQRIRDWIVQYVKQQGVSTRQIVHVSLVSAKKGWGVSGLMKRLFIERLPTDDVYMIGCTNVGKSALINYMMSQSPAASEKKSKAKLRSQYKITSSAAPGTTIGTIKIPLHALGLASSSQHEDDQDEAWKKRRFLARERFLIDTPGLINDNQLLHLLPFKEQKKLLSGGELKPITFRLEPGKSILLKPLIRVDLVESSAPVLLTLFTHLPPHITSTAKLPLPSADSSTDGKVANESGSSLILDSLRPMEHLLRVQGLHRSHATADFAFASVGWMAVAGEFNYARFRIWLPNAVKAEDAFALREPALLPYEYRGAIRKFYGSGERAQK